MARKKNYETPVIDSWMKENFILVPNDTKPKHLKPYQRLVVLRKPEGEKRCIIDLSLPYDQVQILQQQALENGYANVFDTDLLRIIPPQSEIEEKFKKLSALDLELVAKMLTDSQISSGDADIDAMSVQVLDAQKVIPLIKMTDGKIKINLQDTDANIPYSREVDNIDNAKFNIPKEELYNQSWDDFQDYIDSLDVKKSPLLARYPEEQPENVELLEGVELENVEDVVVDPNEFVDVNVNPEDVSQIGDGSQKDYLDEPQAQPESPKVSFFKDADKKQQYMEAQQPTRVAKKVNFYKTAPASEYEKVVFNRKRKMFGWVRKVDKSLLK